MTLAIMLTISVDTTWIGGAWFKPARHKWVPNIVWSALAHSSLATVGAVSIDTTWVLQTGIQITLNKWV